MCIRCGTCQSGAMLRLIQFGKLACNISIVTHIMVLLMFVMLATGHTFNFEDRTKVNLQVKM